MRIDYKTLDSERFYITEKDGQVLITPKEVYVFKMAKNELHLRSVVVEAETGEVISMGFPKFFNWGEWLEGDDMVVQSFCHKKAVTITAKLDGTCIIRSVWKGKVIFRTRGQFDLGTFHDPVMALVKTRHKLLLSPNFCVNSHLIFEYTAPTNQIVVGYSDSHLTPLAELQANFNNGVEIKQFSPERARMLNMEGTLPEYSHANEDEIIRTLKQAEHFEGYVTWVPLSSDDAFTRGLTYSGFHLTKWKTPWYLKLHAMRSRASPRFIREYALQHSLRSLAAFIERLQYDGFDWEVFKYLEPTFLEMHAEFEEIENVALLARTWLTTKGVFDFSERKAKALACKELPGLFGPDWTFHYGILLVTGDAQGAEDVIGAAKYGQGAVCYKQLKASWKKA